MQTKTIELKIGSGGLEEALGELPKGAAIKAVKLEYQVPEPEVFPQYWRSPFGNILRFDSEGARGFWVKHSPPWNNTEDWRTVSSVKPEYGWTKVEVEDLPPAIRFAGETFPIWFRDDFGDHLCFTAPDREGKWVLLRGSGAVREVQSSRTLTEAMKEKRYTRIQEADLPPAIRFRDETFPQWWTIGSGCILKLENATDKGSFYRPDGTFSHVAPLDFNRSYIERRVKEKPGSWVRTTEPKPAPNPPTPNFVRGPRTTDYDPAAEPGTYIIDTGTMTTAAVVPDGKYAERNIQAITGKSPKPANTCEHRFPMFFKSRFGNVIRFDSEHGCGVWVKCPRDPSMVGTTEKAIDLHHVLHLDPEHWRECHDPNPPTPANTADNTFPQYYKPRHCDLVIRFDDAHSKGTWVWAQGKVSNTRSTFYTFRSVADKDAWQRLDRPFANTCEHRFPMFFKSKVSGNVVRFDSVDQYPVYVSVHRGWTRYAVGDRQTNFTFAEMLQSKLWEKCSDPNPPTPANTADNKFPQYYIATDGSLVRFDAEGTDGTLLRRQDRVVNERAYFRLQDVKLVPHRWRRVSDPYIKTAA